MEFYCLDKLSYDVYFAMIKGRKSQGLSVEQAERDNLRRWLVLESAMREDVFAIMNRCVCVKQTIASLMATVAARVVSTSTWITPDGSAERRKVCGNIDYCGPDACRNQTVSTRWTVTRLNCRADYELVLLINDSACVTNECEISLATWMCQLQRLPSCVVRVVITKWVLRTPRHVCSAEGVCRNVARVMTHSQPWRNWRPRQHQPHRVGSLHAGGSRSIPTVHQRRQWTGGRGWPRRLRMPPSTTAHAQEHDKHETWAQTVILSTKIYIGAVMQRNVWNDIGSWQTTRLSNSTKYLLHASMTIPSKKKKQNLLENCQNHALKLF